MKTRGWPDGDNVITRARLTQLAQLPRRKKRRLKGVCKFCGDTTDVTRIKHDGKRKKICDECKSIITTKF